MGIIEMVDVVITFRNGDTRVVKIDKVNVDDFVKSFCSTEATAKSQLVFNYPDQMIIFYTQDVRSIDVKK